MNPIQRIFFWFLFLNWIVTTVGTCITVFQQKKLQQMTKWQNEFLRTWGNRLMTAHAEVVADHKQTFEESEGSIASEATES